MVSIGEKSANNALNDIASYRERVAIDGTRAAELLSTSSTVSS